MMINNEIEQETISMEYLMAFLQIPYRRQSYCVEVPGLTLRSTATGWQSKIGNVSLHCVKNIPVFIQTPCNHYKFCLLYDFMKNITAYTGTYQRFISLKNMGIIEDLIKMITRVIHHLYYH